MKKLNLNAPTFQKGEVLSRSQLKNILGGIGSDSVMAPEGPEEDGSTMVEYGPGRRCCWIHSPNVCSPCNPQATDNAKCTTGEYLTGCQ